MGKDVARSLEFSHRIRGLVDAALQDQGKSARAVSMNVVGHDGLIRDIRKGRLPSIDKLDALFRELGLELYFGPPIATAPTQTFYIGDDEYAKIPLHEVELAAGDGAVPGDDGVATDLVFKRSWLRRVGVAPANARMARVRGKSMEPTLHDGDVVLIDTGRKVIPARPRDPDKPLRADLYALREGDQLRIKRVEHSKLGRLVLHSDNAMLFPPEVREGYDAEELGIIGKVIWWAHTER